MEIVLLLGFADAIFRRERSDDRKCVCASQAIVQAVLAGNFSLILIVRRHFHSLRGINF